MNMENGLIIGKWTLQKTLGTGSFGVVTRWKHDHTGEDLALKMCRCPPEVLQPKLHQHWTREVEMMNTINNDNIVKVKKIPDDLAAGLISYNSSKLPILCMEYCKGGDLRQLLNRPENVNGLPEIEVRSVLSDLKNAISYLHSLKITHRDLKPENVILQPVKEAASPRTHVYKLTDLGYAKEIDSSSVAASFVGTLQYVAPELFYSNTYSNTVDYWSFGLIAFEVLCGNRPFLPNMAPVQWMTHIKNKKSDEICVHQKWNEEIEFSTEIFTENHVSNSLRLLLQDWLRLALEWNPKKRGRVENRIVRFCLDERDDSMVSGEVGIFNELENILNKKILTIFSTPTHEVISHILDECLPFSVIQERIEKDYAIKAAEQLFITANSPSVVVDANNLAVKYWNNNLPIMLYLYQKETASFTNIKPKISPKVRCILENPKCNLNYFHLLDAYTCTYHFISSERELYEMSIKASIIRMDYIRTEMRKLYQLQTESAKSMCKLIEKNDLLNGIIALDKKKIDSQSNSGIDTKLITDWIGRARQIQENAIKLKNAWEQLIARLESVARRCNEIREKETCLKQNNVELLELNNSAQQLVMSLRSVPKNVRMQSKSCVSAAKLLYACLKLRDMLLFNTEHKKYLQMVMDINVETIKMNGLINSAGLKADEFSKSVSDLILKKQEIMWAFFESNIGKSSAPNVKENEPPSLTNFKIGQPVQTFPSFCPQNDVDELQSLIRDNIKLHKNSQDLIEKLNEDKTILSLRDHLILTAQKPGNL